MSQLRTIDWPVNADLRGDGTLPGGWWHDTEDGRMVCDLCPRKCSLKSGDRGFCFVRQNRDGEMVLTTYGKSTGFCIDPIEKKPLNHFYPGTSVLSFGTAGCNLGCKFCQNHDISKARKVELLSEHAMPNTIAQAAVELGCKSVAYTYNDPIIWAEYAIDTAKACRQVGVKSVAVTAGYITEQARRPFFEFFDAANVDLKAFTEDFYERVTLSHLQPVLDTLEWLKRETDVWFEITNLLIPDANDSADEVRKLCDWVLKHVGDEVPVHFSAFHPDFRMLDRERTPHETLLRAHEIAKATGLKYVYVGNVHDAQHQSTYCHGCGKRVIERDWYQLGEYQMTQDVCDQCGTRIPGRFEERPGDWGRKRQPVKISDFAKQGNVVSKTQSKSNVLTLTTDQQSAVLEAASEMVAATVCNRDEALRDVSLSGVADAKVHGVYVSLKRDGRLRGCCGFTGAEQKLIEGMRYSASRTAQEDPRVPPVSPCELPFLDVEVWILGGLLPVQASGADRKDAIQVGRDGLLVQRGQQRGLLLPGVATDNRWDEETFLRQVCIKAKLPPTAWREQDTNLLRFEGTSVKGSFAERALQNCSSARTVVTPGTIDLFAKFCRDNVALLSKGALPNYYLHEVEDGMVNGISLIAKTPDGRAINVSKIAIRPPMPLQSTLFGLCEDLLNGMRQSQMDPASAQVDVAFFEDPAMHGTTQQPDLRGVDQGRSVLLLGNQSAWQFDASKSAEQNLNELTQAIGLRADQTLNVLSFKTHASGPMRVVNRVRAQVGAEVRKPAVAGKFYPATANAIGSIVRSLVPESVAKEKWRAALVPHAGLRYSGRVAAEVMARIEFPENVLIIGPKHTRHGVDWAVAPHQTWDVPGFQVSSNRALVKLLAENIPHLELDAAAHHAEHAIEVELPFVNHFAPKSSVTGVVVGSGNFEACQLFAKGLAKTLTDFNEEILVLISSDMNHFASDTETRRLDELAMAAMDALDAERLLNVVRENEISMCGVLPAVMTLDALQRIAPLTTAERVAYATSADVTGDASRVVGYAGMLFR